MGQNLEKERFAPPIRQNAVSKQSFSVTIVLCSLLQVCHPLAVCEIICLLCSIDGVGVCLT